MSLRAPVFEWSLLDPLGFDSGQITRIYTQLASLEHTAHDFARTVLRQNRDKLQFGGCRNRTQLVAYMLNHLLLEFIARHLTKLEYDKGFDRLTFEWIWLADHCSFSNSGMTQQGIFHICGTYTVASNIHYIVCTSQHSNVAIFVHGCDIACSVVGRHDSPIVEIPLSISPERTYHLWPRSLHDEEPTLMRLDWLTIEIHHLRAVSRKRLSYASCTHFHARQRPNRRTARFRLPPIVADRHLSSSNMFSRPHQCFRIEWLTSTDDGTQAAQIMGRWILRAKFHEHTNSRWSRKELGHAILFDDCPDGVQFWII